MAESRRMGKTELFTHSASQEHFIDLCRLLIAGEPALADSL